MLVTLGGFLIVTTCWMFTRGYEIMDDLDKIAEREAQHDRRR